MSEKLSESEIRLYENILRDLDVIKDFLQDDDVKEILVNDNGSMFIDTASGGFSYVKEMVPECTNRIIRTLAHYAGQSLDGQRVTLEMPIYKCMNGERFNAQIPPMVPSPSFTLRKKPKTVYSWEHYIASGRITEEQRDALIESAEPGTLADDNPILPMLYAERLMTGDIDVDVKENRSMRDLSRDERKSQFPGNIVFCGGPGSGKTTVMNTTLKSSIEINPNQRYLVIEKDMSEVQCRAHHVQRFISNKMVSMRECVETAMVSRPDRIIMSEIKGAEALEMVKAWNTGTPGGMATVHANTPLECFQRIADLCLEAGLLSPPWSQILSAVNVVVWVGRNGSEAGFIKQVLFCKGSEHEETRFLQKIKFTKL